MGSFGGSSCETVSTWIVEMFVFVVVVKGVIVEGCVSCISTVSTSRGVASVVKESGGSRASGRDALI